jgi:hypothetical protein
VANAIRQVVQAIAGGAVVRPLAVDIVLRTKDTAIGMMHTACTQHLPDEGWEFLGRAVLDMDRMQRFLDAESARCDWCGFILYL